MFGYIRTDLPNLYIKDSVLYQSFYCGLCKSIGGKCGQCGRFALNYDLTFLSALAHNLAGEDIKIEKQRCVLHWFIGRPVAVRDELSDRIACLNVILAYYKVADDIEDDKKGRGKRAFLRKSYRRAAAAESAMDEIVRKNYAELVAYEKTGGGSVDMAADPFGRMIRELFKELLGEKCGGKEEELGYNLGKWIYLIDALDDFDKDKKKGRYNPFVYAYPDVQDRETLCREKKEEVEFIFGTLLTAIAAGAKELKYQFNHDLTDNILFRGLGVRTKQVMAGEKKKKEKGAKNAGKL